MTSAVEMVRHARTDRAAPSAAGRVLPHDLDAEAAVLSAVLIESDALAVVSTQIAPADFYSPANAAIFEACLAVAAGGQPVDVLTVPAWLRDRGQFERVGGVAYINQIADCVPSVSHVEAYAAVVAAKARRRRMIAECQRIAAEGYGDVGDEAEWLDAAEASVFRVASDGKRGGGVESHPFRVAIEAAVATLEATWRRGSQITGIATGFERLDAMTSGLHAGDLTIIAARPGMGKTALAMQIGSYVAGADGDETIGVPVFSLEMPKEQLAARELAARARVDLRKFRSGQLSQSDWSNVTSAAIAACHLPLWVCDTPGLTTLALRAQLRRIKATFDGPATESAKARRVGVVIVDYMQLMRGDASRGREQEVSEISRTLKQIAREERVAMVVLSQLNRDAEKRGKGARPQLSDLRESGAIEQDADNVFFVHRPGYFERDNAEIQAHAEIVVAKQRNGPTGVCRLRWNAPSTSFQNLAPGEWDGGDDE